VIEDLYADRSRFARRSEWVVAPEMVLLEACDSEERKSPARELLQVRGQLTPGDVSTRTHRGELAAAEVLLAKYRAGLADKGVLLAGETLEHMRKWRSISNWGIAALVCTTIFSMLAVCFLLLDLVPGGKVSDAAVPVIIFVLALFAISPGFCCFANDPCRASTGGALRAAVATATTARKRRAKRKNPHSPIVLPMISFMISSVPPPIGPRRASRTARSMPYSRM